jgi:NDP-sugar pyrophosphorylase family protein
MSGFGERFRRAGYTVPKPLIEIEGKPVIAHVVDMFPGETDFVFICNQQHLDDPDYRMAQLLSQCCPSGKIVGIAPHRLGPVHAVLQISDLLDASEPVVVNYCDFTCYWDWHHFKRFVATTRASGAIPAYRGFHPHSLGTTNYAYMREHDGWVLDIQEKQPFTSDRMQEFASSGTYYFASAALMLDAFRKAMAQDLSINGEYYVSLAYRPLLAAGEAVAVYPLQHFMQWGTPEDVAEYRNWSAAFHRLATHAEAAPQRTGTAIVPMAGLGSRFAREGYELTKPLIPVSGLPMVVQATHDLPAAQDHVFVLRSDMPEMDAIAAELLRHYPDAIISTVDSVTEGQACTALIGLDALEAARGTAAIGPVTIGACDNGALYDAARLHKLMDDDGIDVIVWGVRGYANAVRHPHMYGWIDAEDGIIRSVSVKTPLAAPHIDPIVVGTFTFRRARDFREAVKRLIERDGRINGEFYIDACINDAIALGLRCHLFEIDSYLCWGTPNDLRTFEYWQSCFHKWPAHPYRLEHDERVPAARRDELAQRYRATVPALPGEHA